MGLVGVNRALVAFELGGNGEAGVPGRDEHVPKHVYIVDGEAVALGTNAARAMAHEALVPAAAIAELGDMPEELGDGGTVAVADGLEEGDERARAHRLAWRETGKRARVAVAVALRAHARLADRLRARAPRGDRIGIGAEDSDLAGVETAMSEGHVRDEARETASHDRAVLAHRSPT